MIEAHTLGAAPSLQTLHFLQQRSVAQSGQALVVGIDRANASSAVIVGNPDMPSLPQRIGGPLLPLSQLPGLTGALFVLGATLSVLGWRMPTLFTWPPTASLLSCWG